MADSKSEPALDFSLPTRPPSAQGPKGGGLSTVLILLAVLIGIANLAMLIMRLPSSGQEFDSAAGQIESKENSGEERALALKLEGQGLKAVAADTWENFVDASSPDRKDASSIWYRIGKLRQEADQHELALAAFYRSEGLNPESDLRDEIGRRVQESLEATGKFAALKHELADRVSMEGSNASDSSEVLAEIGAQKITRTELDHQIEANIENQLARFAGRMSDEDRKRQKQAMLKQFSTDPQRLQFLQSFIAQELLHRKAREAKLHEDATVRAQLQDVERGMLAQQLIATELASRINITDSDLQTYYTANTSNYREPPSAEISHLLVAEETRATELCAELTEADFATFAARAKEESLDEATKAAGGAISTPVREGTAPPVGLPAEVVTVALNSDDGSLLPSPFQSEKGFHVIFVRSKTAERQKPFDEVRQVVYQKLRSQKESEVEQQLLNSLRDQYNVVIHQSRFKSADGE